MFTNLCQLEKLNRLGDKKSESLGQVILDWVRNIRQKMEIKSTGRELLQLDGMGWPLLRIHNRGRLATVRPGDDRFFNYTPIFSSAYFSTRTRIDRACMDWRRMHGTRTSIHVGRCTGPGSRLLRRSDRSSFPIIIELDHALRDAFSVDSVDFRPR